MLSILLIILVIFIAFFIIYTLDPILAPIPYFPTSSIDIKPILKALNLKPEDVLYDLGAGDGKVIFQASKTPGIKVVGVEINPFLVLIMRFKNFFHPYKERVEIVWKDIFVTDLSSATKIYLFVGPYVMKKIINYIITHKSQKLKKLVSYGYSTGLKNEKVKLAQKPIYVVNF